MEDFSNLGVNPALVTKGVRDYYRVSVREHDLSVIFNVPSFYLLQFIDVCLTSLHPVSIIEFITESSGN